MTSVNLDDATTNLRRIIAGLSPGEQLVILDNEEAVATLTRSQPREWPCKAGSASESPHWMAPDFDAPLEEFREYME